MNEASDPKVGTFLKTDSNCFRMGEDFYEWHSAFHYWHRERCRYRCLPSRRTLPYRRPRSTKISTCEITMAIETHMMMHGFRRAIGTLKILSGRRPHGRCDDGIGYTGKHGVVSGRFIMDIFGLLAKPSELIMWVVAALMHGATATPN